MSTKFNDTAAPTILRPGGALMRARITPARLESEQLLSGAQRIAPLGSWQLDLRTDTTRWSSGLYEITGLPPSGGPDMEALLACVHDDDREALRGLRQRILAGGSMTVEYRFTAPGRKERTLAAYGEMVRSESGEPLRIVGFVQDITERKHAEDQLRRQTVRQEAIAQLSAEALVGSRLVEFFDRAVRLVADVVGADRVELFEHHGGDEYAVTAAWNWPDAPIGTAIEMEPETGVAFATRTGNPYVINDMLNDDALRGGRLLIADGMRSAVGAPTKTREGRIFGVFAAHSRKTGTFGDDDRKFIQTVANVIAQTIERQRMEEELRAAAEQQIALAQFARRALGGISQQLLDSATELALSLLDVEHCSLYELDAPADQLLFKAGYRFRQEALTLPADTSTQLGLALRSEGVIVADDYTSEQRFPAAVLVEHGVASGMCVAIRGERSPFGAIGVFTRSRRRFTEREAHFLQSLANALAEAMERDAAQRALVASEERYRAVVEGASEVIYTIDERGLLTSLNSAFGRVTGWTREEWIGRPFVDIIGSEDRDRSTAAYVALMSGGRIDDVEFNLVNRDGGLTPIRVSAGPMYKNGRIIGIQGFARDVTQARRADEERMRLEAQLEQANRLTSLGRLAATIAHEFNNVLMGISPFVEVLRRPNLTPERQTTALDHMAAAMKRGKRVTEEILRYTRPSPPVIDRVEVLKVQTALLTEVKSMLSSSYDVTVDVQDRGLAVLADANQLHQILSNLVLNARDAMPDGGPIAIRFSRPAAGERYGFGVLSHPEQMVHITVADKGCGMAPETLRHIFEPLFTTKRTGTGLGLAVTHQVVKHHGGELFVESTPGVGSTFHIFLPAAEQAEAAAGAEPEDRARIHATRVLLVEDDVNVASGIAVLLQEEGMDVHAVTTGGEVMPAIGRRRPDVIVLDIGLPDVDGTEVYSEVIARHPGLPVVFSTGHGDERKIAPYLKQGNVAMLLKPYTIETLLETIAAVQQVAVG